jgi:hypothetical protein
MWQVLQAILAVASGPQQEEVKQQVEPNEQRETDARVRVDGMDGSETLEGWMEGEYCRRQETGPIN